MRALECLPQIQEPAGSQYGGRVRAVSLYTRLSMEALEPPPQIQDPAESK